MADDPTAVDDIITAVPGQWRFDADVAASFDTHVRKSVPGYDTVQQMVVDMSEFFISDHSVVYDIGASTGETLYRLAGKHAGKTNLRFIGIERSQTMVTQARKKLAQVPGIRFIHEDARNVARFDSPDLVVSLYTLQFLSIDERYRLLSKLFAEMNTGGALILAEKVHAEAAGFQNICNELHWDFKREQGLTDAMILAKARSLRGVLKPLSLDENCEMLRWAGFQTVEVFFKWLNWAGIIAIKSAPEIASRPSEDPNGSPDATGS